MWPLGRRWSKLAWPQMFFIIVKENREGRCGRTASAEKSTDPHTIPPAERNGKNRGKGTNEEGDRLGKETAINSRLETADGTNVLPNFDILHQTGLRANSCSEATRRALRTDKYLRKQIPQWMLFSITAVYRILEAETLRR